MAEAEPSSLRSYDSFSALFSRGFKAGARPIDDLPNALVSPVDGTVMLCAQAAGGRVEMAPGKTLLLNDLIGRDAPEDAHVLVCYLSPKNHHRVYAPCDAHVLSHQHFPGDRWPVFPAFTRRIKQLFSRNERVVIPLQTDHGELLLVMVAAFGVGHITWPGGGAAVDVPHPFHQPITRGEWLGTFELGSTVVLVCPADIWGWEVETGDSLRVGQRIGSQRSPSCVP